MVRFIVAIGALLWTASVSAADRAAGPAGFTCSAADGTIKRLNIDLKRQRYDAGEGVKRIARVSDSTITLDGGNPDLMSTPMGPVLSSLVLDRTTLILTDQTLIPDRNVNRTSTYRCELGPAIDFRAGRRF